MAVRPLRLLGFLIWLLACAHAQAAKHVWVVLAAETATYQEVVQALRQRVDKQAGADLRWSIGVWDAMPKSAAPPDVVVSVGAVAWREVAAHFANAPRAPPLIATLLPAQSYNETRRSIQALKATALWLDQPLSRQVHLVRELLPKATRVGVLLGSESALRGRQLADALGRVGLQGNLVESDESSLVQGLVRVFESVEAVLLPADRSIANSRTLPLVLAASFRRAVPVIAYSPAVVGAGALAAVYSTPAQNGEAAAEAVMAALLGRALPEPGSGGDFTVSMNASVARSLGIAGDAEALTARLRKLEGEGKS